MKLISILALCAVVLSGCSKAPDSDKKFQASVSLIPSEYRLRYDVSRIEPLEGGDDDWLKPDSEFCVMHSQIFSKGQVEKLFEGFDKLPQLKREFLFEREVIEGDDCSIRFGDWVGKVTPSQAEQYLIQLDSSFTHEGESKTDTRSIQIYDGYTIAFQVFEESKAAYLLFVSIAEVKED